MHYRPAISSESAGRHTIPAPGKFSISSVEEEEGKVEISKSNSPKIPIQKPASHTILPPHTSSRSPPSNHRRLRRLS